MVSKLTPARVQSPFQTDPSPGLHPLPMGLVRAAAKSNHSPTGTSIGILHSKRSLGALSDLNKSDCKERRKGKSTLWTDHERFTSEARKSIE